ncbi:MAG: hypothetical protein SFZ23_04630 [Planctomycetota bacterium]|nr:hypothetical protein [Planctomycetota bacterium]
MAVNRCTCLDLKFSELKAVAEQRGIGFEELRQLTRCGTGCGLCTAYIIVMLRTGVTDLPVMSPEEYRKALNGYKPNRDKLADKAGDKYHDRGHAASSAPRPTSPTTPPTFTSTAP